MAYPLNICLISREFPPDTAFGGIATFSIDTALMMKERGHDVTVFSQSLEPSHVTDYRGVSVRKIQVPRPFGSYRVLPMFIIAFNLMIHREVMRCHRARPFDLIDVPDHLAEGLFATHFSGIPVVTRLHTPYALIVAMALNNYKKDFSYRLIRMMEQRALRSSQALYAPCTDLVRRCDDLFGLSGVPTKIFGYPLDLEMFSPKRDVYEGPPRILFLGRLEQRKGIETIAAAFPKVRARHPGVTLTLVGRDTPNIEGFSSARQYLESVFAHAGCSNAVRFAEYVPLEELPEIFHNHDIVWVPSLYDNYPLVCLEAMACGKAVVVSDAGGLPEMVKHGETGLVFPKGDADAFANETMTLCASPFLRQHIGNNGRLYTEENCSLDIIYEQTLELYRLAIENRTRGGA
jgi:glycosyltransferase involved in cell wall biosynthesis